MGFFAIMGIRKCTLLVFSEVKCIFATCKIRVTCTYYMLMQYALHFLINQLSRALLPAVQQQFENCNARRTLATKGI